MDEEKLNMLTSLFKKSDRILVAFSGGVDSSFLLYVLNKFTNSEVKGLTIKTPYIPQWEVDEASSFCKKHDIDHQIIELPFPESVINNPGDRCYRCKKILFSKISEYAQTEGFNIIADGSNADDTGDYRPGMKALKELEIHSPLLELGIGKQEIRNKLKEFGLEVWNKPAYACLLTRLQHDVKVENKALSIVEKAEVYIKELGFPGTRVRLHGDLARLECPPTQITAICSAETSKNISEYIKNLGVKYVTIDIDGYRTGSMNSEKSSDYE